MSKTLVRLACVGLGFLSHGSTAQEAPAPDLTFTEDVKIEKSTPAFVVSDTNSQPFRAFHLRYFNAAFELWDPVRSSAALRVYHGGGNPGFAGRVYLQGPEIGLSGTVNVNGVGSTATSLFVGNADRPTVSPLALIEDSNATVASRNLLRLRNRGASTFRFDNVSTGQSWGFGSLGSGNFFMSSSGAPSVGLTLTPGGDLTIAGTLVQGSSREIKDDVRPVEVDSVLDRLAALPISTWRYKHAPGTLHMGPMAQDFAAVFGLGPDDRHVAPGDLAAVGLAAAQALRAELAQLRAEVEDLRTAKACRHD
jgi:hypothetical protein